MADQFFQMKQRNVGNTDWDNLFPSSKFETAGGTATVITVAIQDLIDGVSKTFVASASNNAVATTINGKNLYKPNTTTAPTLIAGKAYTVWYSASNDCFFIKASATGTVTSDKVLAGETYSTEDDTDLVGTMDLKAENIREGIAYAGIVGTVEEKQDFSTYVKNKNGAADHTYMPIGFIENEGLWVTYLANPNSIGSAEKAILLDMSGNIIKQITNPDPSKYYSPFQVTKNYIVWVENNLGQYSVLITNKNGTIITDQIMANSIKGCCVNEKVSTIYAIIVGSPGISMYNFSWTLLSSGNISVGETIVSFIPTLNGFFIISHSNTGCYVLEGINNIDNTGFNAYNIYYNQSYLVSGYGQILSSVLK